jgi:4-hydroxybenzoate polyprenyltransferase/phosphoglycolate phosphatase-like HAD superfamily hydrolase
MMPAPSLAPALAPPNPGVVPPPAPRARSARVAAAAAAPTQSTPPRPLVVDLDDTLVRTNTLFEAVLAIAFQQPARLPATLATLRHGRARFKRTVADAAGLDCAILPYDEAVLGAIADRQAAGGAVHLVTAADQSIADGVAATLGLFDSATGSDGRTNLKSANKAAHLAERFPHGFDYIGDSPADTRVWHAAGSAIVAGDRGGLTRRLERQGLAVTILPRPQPRVRTWLKALRLHQWSKNALLFVPLVLAQEFVDPALTLRVIAGFVLFGLVASGTYLINDLSDLAADRLHRTKRFRALPAGLIGVGTAFPLALLLLFGGLAGALLLHGLFGATLAAYAGLTLLYSFKLKRLPLVDVAAIAGLFALRIIAGMVIIDHAVSLWLVTFTMVLFLSLALAKRTAELVQAGIDGRGAVKGRGYLPGDAPLTMALGIATGVVSIVVMVLYMTMEAMPTGLYVRHGPLLLIPIVVGLWIMRIWVLAHRGTLNDDPVVYAIRDRASWFHAATVGGLWMLAAMSLP